MIILIALTYVVTAAMHGSGAQSVVVLVQLLTVWLVLRRLRRPGARRIAGFAVVIGGLLTVLAWIAGSIADAFGVFFFPVAGRMLRRKLLEGIVREVIEEFPRSSCLRCPATITT